MKKEELPSHARHMVQVAQEKADLTEQSEILAKQIEKEEEELASLEQGLKNISTPNLVIIFGFLL